MDISELDAFYNKLKEHEGYEVTCRYIRNNWCYPRGPTNYSTSATLEMVRILKAGHSELFDDIVLTVGFELSLGYAWHKYDGLDYRPGKIAVADIVTPWGEIVYRDDSILNLWKQAEQESQIQRHDPFFQPFKPRSPQTLGQILARNGVEIPKDE